MVCEDMSNRLRPPQAERAYALAAELRTIIGKLKRRLREHGSGDDLTPSQISVILRLESEGSATVSSLARVEGMRPQSMAAVIGPLEAAGLLRSAPDPSDGRQTLLSLSKTCQKWIQDGRAARQDWLTRTIQSKLSGQEQGKLAAAVELLARLVED
jgi:DNA-binding MarR family transcriptional regulator